MVPWDKRAGKDSGTTGVHVERTEGRPFGPMGLMGQKRWWDYRYICRGD